MRRFHFARAAGKRLTSALAQRRAAAP